MARRWQPSLRRFSRRLGKQMLRFGLPLIGLVLLDLVLSVSDRYLLQIFKDAAQVGIYAAGYRIAETGVFAVVLFLNLAAFPVLIKVFESEDVDVSKFAITTMRGIKRSTRGRGHVLGHRFGVDSDVLLLYREARYRIYLPTYRHVLENNLAAEIEELRRLLESQDVVLLDNETNTDVENLSKPLSHAGLIVAFLNGQWPG